MENITLSEITIKKLCIKLNRINDYFLLYQQYKDKFNSGVPIIYHQPDRDVFRNVIHGAIYPLYRSLFKEIEGDRLDIQDFTEDENIISTHKAIIKFVDKDICHHDKNSDTFKVVEDDGNGRATVMQSGLSDEQLENIVSFLKDDFAKKFNIIIN